MGPAEKRTTETRRNAVSGDAERERESESTTRREPCQTGRPTYNNTQYTDGQTGTFVFPFCVSFFGLIFWFPFFGLLFSSLVLVSFLGFLFWFPCLVSFFKVSFFGVLFWCPFLVAFFGFLPL